MKSKLSFSLLWRTLVHVIMWSVKIAHLKWQRVKDGHLKDQVGMADNRSTYIVKKNL